MGKFWESSGGAALISGIGSIGSGLFSGWAARSAIKRQYKYNLKLQKQQQDWQKQMWDLENLYNLPINEVKRLRDASINPALAFSNGGSTAAPVPQSGSAGGVSAPTASMPNVGASAVQAALAAQALENQTKATDAEVALKEAEADRVEQETNESKSRENLNTFRYNLDMQLRPIIVDNQFLANGLKRLDYALGLNSLERDNQYTAVYGQFLGNELDQSYSRSSIMRLEASKIERSFGLIQAQIDYLKSSGRLNDAQARLVRERTMVAVCESYYAEWQRGILEKARKQKYDKESGQAIPLLDDLALEAIRKEYVNRVTSLDFNAASMSNDIEFENSFGLGSRYYQQYEGPRRQANRTRVNLYTDVVNAASGALGAAVSAAVTPSSNAVRRSLVRVNESTLHKFEPTLYRPKYHGGQIYVPDVSFPTY